MGEDEVFYDPSSKKIIKLKSDEVVYTPDYKRVFGTDSVVDIGGSYSKSDGSPLGTFELDSRGNLIKTVVKRRD